MRQEIKRLFFGIEVHAPWPQELPKGRLLDEAHRHMTLSFLGNIPYAPLLSRLEQIPTPPLRLGAVGFFDECLLLPHRHPNVVAWHAQWWEGWDKLQHYHDLLNEWLALQHYSIDQRPWKPHVTVCRRPFEPEDWIVAFTPLPFYTSHIHLFESTGNLTYVPIFTLPIEAPFDEIAHTADVAFLVKGETLTQLYRNACAALCFKVPELLNYVISDVTVNSLVDIVVALNVMICNADAAVGCPMKAVSFHGEIVVQPDSLLQWEMIVDV